MDTEGWLAQFRVHSTITTQLTHIVPPRSTVLGLFFAKLGLLKDYSRWPTEKYNEYLEKVKIGIAYNRKRIKKFIDYNLYYLGKTNPNPTEVEYIVDPSYYFILLYDDEDPLLSRLEPNKEVFKIYFGINECPVVINRCQFVNYKEKSKGIVKTRFVIPKEVVDSIRLNESDKKPNIEFETIPYFAPPINYHDYKDKKAVIDLYVPLGNEVEFQLKQQYSIYEVIIDGKKEEVVLI
jgi:CRISPR-associated Cas5-like protein